MLWGPGGTGVGEADTWQSQPRSFWLHALGGTLTSYKEAPARGRGENRSRFRAGPIGENQLKCDGRQPRCALGQNDTLISNSPNNRTGQLAESETREALTNEAYSRAPHLNVARGTTPEGVRTSGPTPPGRTSDRSRNATPG